MSNPWLKFYPSDWASDPKLGFCSLAARGLWMEILCLMHEAEPRGSLLINGRQPSARQIAILARCTPDEAVAALRELEDAGVFDRDDEGVIVSRKMKRDEEKSAKAKADGAKGGNPTLKNEAARANDNPGVKGQDKPQIPEARKSSEANASGTVVPLAVDPTIAERALFERGREVLGKKAGGVIANLLRSKGGNPALARAALEEASQRQNPMEFLMAGMRKGQGNAGKNNLLDAASELREFIAGQQPDMLRLGGG